MSTTVSPGIAAELDRHHALAQEHATAAIDHARQAGLLLLQVKAELGHGRFLPWLTVNAKFTARTAQRYMNAAAPTPKATRLSYSGRRPRPGTKRALQIAVIDQSRQRQDVVAHVSYLVAELPAAQDFGTDDLAALIRLRDTLNTVLGASHG